MSSVQVLLSTYNGERYVKQQLDSIIEQTHSNIVILIRDDGSTDNTISIIQSYVETQPHKIRLIKGQNVGVVRSFMELIKASDNNHGYYCFCDQDDIWLTQKVERAINNLSSKNKPAMVFTSTQMINEQLEPLKQWPEQPIRPIGYFNAIFENVAVGATITINKKARDLLSSVTVNPSEIMMHDWWTYLCVSAFGEVIYDARPSILYRQHDSNVVGGNQSFLQKMNKKWASFQKHWKSRLLHRQALEFSRHYAHLLDSKKREQLEWFLEPRSNWIQRYRYLKKCRLYRQSWLEKKLFQFFIMIGYI